MYIYVYIMIQLHIHIYIYINYKYIDIIYYWIYIYIYMYLYWIVFVLIMGDVWHSVSGSLKQIQWCQFRFHTWANRLFIMWCCDLWHCLLCGRWMSDKATGVSLGSPEPYTNAYLRVTVTWHDMAWPFQVHAHVAAGMCCFFKLLLLLTPQVRPPIWIW